jgi:hypothetical protein
MSNAIIPANLDTAAPPPLAPLTHVVINPANIAVESRRKGAVKLTRREQAHIRRELQAVRRSLKKHQYQEIAAVRAALRSQLQDYHDCYLDLKEQLAASPDDAALQEQWSALREESAPIRARWDVIQSQYQQLIPLRDRYMELTRALENHQIAVARDKAENSLYNQMIKEAKIYERLIIDKWTRLGFCHKYKEGDKSFTDKVSFSKVGITLDAIYFKIATSSQTVFKNWQTDLPDTVKVTSQLLDAETLDELSITCQRQVTGVHSPAGAWVIVHRLDSVDGLMNYVAYGDIMERYPYAVSDKVPVCVGVGLNREVKWVNLGDFPHWLIGGFTGSGKSNFVNVGICTMISQHKPDDLRLVLIDLKGGLEFDTYKGIPHLHGDTVDTVPGVADCLAEVEALMKERFKKFRGVARRYEEYRVRRPHEPMPRLVVIFDEVASIMEHGETTKRILSSLREITRQGRAVGIHVWLCTQRPDVEAIAGSVKANLNVRISGRMTTSQDSITVLGSSAAKDLAPVPGRMVLQLGPDPEPVQTPHIKEDDIDTAIKVALQHAAPAPLELPAGARVIHQEWTAERVIELSIKHLGGNVTFRKVYEAADGLTQSQARALVEQIWNMGEIVFEGKQYRVEIGKSNVRRLVEFEQESEGIAISDVYTPDSTQYTMPISALHSVPNYAEVEFKL